MRGGVGGVRQLRRYSGPVPTHCSAPCPALRTHAQLYPMPTCALDADGCLRSDVVVDPFRFLQREFLRLVCQVHRNHEEAVRVVDETKEHVDNVKYGATSTFFYFGTLSRGVQLYPIAWHARRRFIIIIVYKNHVEILISWEECCCNIPGQGQ